MNRNLLIFFIFAFCITLLSSCRNADTLAFTPQIDPTLVFDPDRTDHGRDWFTSSDKLSFVDPKGRKWTAPVGTITDGASIPDSAIQLIGVERIGILDVVTRLPREFEPHFRAALIHDAYCGGENAEIGANYQTATWREVHRMFFDACIAGDTNEKLAKTMFSAVWLFGPRWGDDSALIDRANPTTLIELFGIGKKWIEEKNPPCEQIEQWMVYCEQPLIEENRIVQPN